MSERGTHRGFGGDAVSRIILGRSGKAVDPRGRLRDVRARPLGGATLSKTFHNRPKLRCCRLVQLEH